MLLRILKILFIIISLAVSIGWSGLYFVGIYQKKHIIKVENIYCTHNEYAESISCSFKIMNIAKQPITINKIYIKSQVFKSEKCFGEIEDKNSKASLPVTLSMLDTKKIAVTFPVDLSIYEDFSDNKSLSKPWILVLQTNRLPRRYKISSPF